MFIGKYLKPYRKLLALVLVLAAINQVFSLLDPQVYRRTLDNVVLQFQELSREEFLRGILIGMAGLVGVAMISRIAKNFQDYFVNVMTQKIGMQIYQETIRHAFSLPYAVFEDQSSGQLLQKLLKARADIEGFIRNLINIVFVSLVAMVFVLIYSFIVHWIVGVIYAALIPIMTFTSSMLSRRIKKAQSSIVTESAALAGTTTEAIRNVSLIKLLGLEKQEMNRLEDANTGILGLELKKIKIVRTIEFLQGTLINAIRVALIGTMFRLIFQWEMTIGEFFSLLFYSFWILNGLTQFGEVIKSYQEAKASMETLDDIMDMKPAPVPQKPTEIETVHTMAFDHVSFSYTEEKQTLHEISWEVQAGKTVAFVGPSGSGKSTIIKLLCGLYPATKGNVLVNDVNINTLDPHAFATHLGIVTQDTQLFNGTIKDNLQFVAPEATDEEMMQVLRYASIEEIVSSNKAGLLTKIGEGWLKLSGGQRQRLAIARALLRNPDVLIFDEATSSLDSLIEAEITETIKEVSHHKQGLMTILVAHRLSTIMHADTIFVMEKGKIVEHGSHDELLENKGLYRALWRQQIGESE